MPFFIRNSLPVLLPGDELWFPDPRLALKDGLVAVGGDLSVPRLLLAYRSGIFPWTDDPITWWSPDPRAIIELDQLHVPQSLAKLLRKQRFQVTRDRAFRKVIEACGHHRTDGTWVTPQFVSAYTELHRDGHAHSIEVWLDGQLAGGIYGVAIAGFFAGESMFHRESNASKVALFHLVQHLREAGFALFDIQMLTPVTQAMGGILIPRLDYLERLKAATSMAARFSGTAL